MIVNNIGTVDRGTRFIAGLALISISFLPPSAPLLSDYGLWRWVAAAIGVVMIATAAMRFCPAYTLLGVNTCERSK
jgi:predicted membrane-bound dolichyl-phosphate-mannose-protein mannosyltransferase